MHHILVVDDDPIVLNGICTMIKLCHSDPCEILSAENGSRAFEIICSRRIDILLTDIKMPVCDGIELIKKVSDLEYQPQIVVISGFDDYHLVRRALKLGAVDYLLKPIEVDEFSKLLRLCAKNIQSQDHDKHMRPNLIQEIYENQFHINALLSSTSDMDQFIERYHVKEEDGCILYLMDNFVHAQPSDREKQLIYLDIASYLDEYYTGGEDFVLLQGEYKKLWVVLIAGDKYQILKGNTAFEHYLDDKNIKHAFSITSLKDIASAYDDCILALSDYFYDLTISEDTAMESYPNDKILSSIKEAIRDKRFTLASQKLMEFLCMACLNKTPIIQLKQLLVNVIYGVMSENNEFIHIISKYKFTNHDVTHIIQEATSCTKLYKGVIDTLDLYINQAMDESNDEEYIIKKTKQYIDNGFMRDISLGYVAEKLGIHPNYLSTIFKSKTGISYSQYLREVRINEAKHLLKTTNMRLYEIAKNVGYQDSSHFHRVFKKVTGVSPGKFKNLNY